MHQLKVRSLFILHGGPHEIVLRKTVNRILTTPLAKKRSRLFHFFPGQTAHNTSRLPDFGPANL
jgi:hypothetical protein